MKKSLAKYISFKPNLKKPPVIILLIVTVYILSSVHIGYDYRQGKRPPTSSDVLFLNQLESDRLGRFFDILQETETKYFGNYQLGQQLGLISFERIKSVKTRNSTDAVEFEYEINEFLRLDRNDRIKPTYKFVEYLKNKSSYFSYKKPRNNFEMKKLTLVSLKMKVLNVYLLVNTGFWSIETWFQTRDFDERKL